MPKNKLYPYHQNLAKSLGIKLLAGEKLNALLRRSIDELDKLFADLNDLRLKKNKSRVEHDYAIGDSIVCCHNDEGYFSAILQVLAVAANNPGRKAWAIGFIDEGAGLPIACVIAADTMAAAMQRIEKDRDACAKKCRKLMVEEARKGYPL